MALYVGTHNREYFRKHGLADSQLRWAPHSVENERFSDRDGALQREANEWRQQLHIAANARVILFAGKLEPKKAPDLLLECFLERQRKDEHLVIAGAGPLEQRLVERAEGNSRIHFLGFQNQSRMPLVYRLGDIYVLPSRGPGETWGLAVNEAMASARPVIVSSRVGCAPDLVGDGKTGAVFSSDDRADLDLALSRLLDSHDLRVSLGLAATHRIARWTLTEQATAIETAVALLPTVKDLRSS
jgi:glycosyltransferase involved in cell wall biosynthesis